MKRNIFRQDLQDYFDFCAFPEKRHKLNCPSDSKLFFLRWRIEVAQGPLEPEQKYVNPDGFVKSHRTSIFVIPVKTGIQCF